MGGRVARMGGVTCAYKFQLEHLKRERPLRRLMRRWYDNIGMGRKELG
jgi:hypothetical protein